MNNQIPWIERTFNFEFPTGVLPTIIERLRGTPCRVKALTEEFPEDILEIKPDGKWSIKERIGHIADVEQLWENRLEQFLGGETRLEPADMSNQRTKDANHNQYSIGELLNRLQATRQTFIDKLDKLTIADAGLTAIHPRLNKPMRLIDMLYFAAEHDDNEIALMRRVAIAYMKS